MGIFHSAITVANGGMHPPLGDSTVGTYNLTGGVAAAYEIQDETNKSLIEFDTSADEITLGDQTAVPTYDVEIRALELTITLADTTTSAMEIVSTDAKQYYAVNTNLQLVSYGAGGSITHSFVMDASSSTAWRVSDGTQNWIVLATDTPVITMGNATDNPAYVWLGSGTFSIGGGIGSAAQVLTSNGAGAAPTWQAAAGASQLTDLSDVTAKTGSGTIVVMQTSPTIVTPTIASFANATHNHSNAAGGGTFAITNLSDVAGKTGSGTVVVMQGSPTLTTPTIASFANALHDHTDASSGGQLDHGAALTGLSDDDHTQYALLAGRADSQTLIGGTAASEDLHLQSTANATKGTVFVGDDGADVSVGTAASQIGFFGATLISRPSDIGAYTDNTGGSADKTFGAVDTTVGEGMTAQQQSDVDDNFAECATAINALRDLLSSGAGGLGLTA